MASLPSLIACTGLALASGTAIADPVVFYQNDFEAGPAGPEFSGHVVLSEHASFSRFMGRHSKNQWFKLTVPAPIQGADVAIGEDDDLGGIGPIGDGPGDGGDGDDGGNDGDGGNDDGGNDDGGDGGVTEYLLAFDLYVIDSWDGHEKTWGTDFFKVKVNGVGLFQETFANQHDMQSFEGEPETSGTNLGYTGWNDSIYRQIEVPFTLSPEDDVIEIMFLGIGLQNIVDESWGVDNVNLSYEVAPAPPAVWAGLVGLVGVGAGVARRRLR